LLLPIKIKDLTHSTQHAAGLGIRRTKMVATTQSCKQNLSFSAAGVNANQQVAAASAAAVARTQSHDATRHDVNLALSWSITKSQIDSIPMGKRQQKINK